jgi:hypothetical protein
MAAWIESWPEFRHHRPHLIRHRKWKIAGETFSSKRPPGDGIAVDIESISEKPIAQIEILVNGEVVESVVPDLMKTPAGAWRAKVNRRVTIKETSWLAVRSIEPQPDGRKRFAHTAP